MAGQKMTEHHQTNYVTENDVKMLTDPDKVEMPFRLIYQVLFYSALRITELLTTTVEQLKRIDNKYFIELYDQKNKTRAELAPLRMQDYLALKDYAEYNKRQPSDYIFQTRRHNAYSYIYINGKLKEHRKQVGIAYHLSSHCFRRGRVVYLKQKGIDYAEIKTLTRHKSVDVLIDTYDKKSKDVASKLVEM